MGGGEALPYWVILGMCGQIDIILLGSGWFSSKLSKTYCNLVNFCGK